MSTASTTTMEQPTNQNNFNLLDDASITAAVENLGVAKTRKMFEEAIEGSLSASRAVELCLKYAEFEKSSTKDLDRARAIYIYASQLANPATDVDFWATWSDFERHFGCDDTTREMLRIKRTVTHCLYQYDETSLPEFDGMV